MTTNRIHVQLKRQLKWKDRRTVETIATELTKLGFEESGQYHILELKDFLLRCFFSPADHGYAVIYEHSQLGVWLDLFSRYAPNQSTWSYTATNIDSPMVGVLDKPPGVIVVKHPKLTPKKLFHKFISDRPDGKFAPVSAKGCPRSIEEAYSHEMNWRAQRGGTTAQEVARVAALPLKKVKSGAKPKDAFKELLHLLHGVRLEPARRRRPPKSLTGAVRTGDIDLVKQFIAAGFDLNEKTVGFASPLNPAISAGNSAIVDLLLKHGCNPRQPGMFFTPMYTAGETGNVSLLQRLIKAGVKLKEEGRTALDAAARNGHVEAVQFLLKAGVSAPRKILTETIAVASKNKGKNPSQELQSAIVEMRERKEGKRLEGVYREGAILRILEIIRSGTIKGRVNERGGKGQHPLTMAAENGDLEVVKALIDAGAKPNPVTVKSYAPLHAACSNGHAAIVSLLLKAGANPNATTRTGGIPLIQAVEWGDPEPVKMLLEAGADVTQKNSIGQTALNINAGLHHKTIQAMLKAARDKQHGKPTRSGSGLNCTEIKGVKPATMRGTSDFKDFHGQPEWAIAIVRAPAATVAGAYAKITKAVRWDADVAHKRIPAAKHGIFIIQLKDNPWSLILRSLGWIDIEELENLPKEALQISKQLKTRVYTFMAEDTSSCEGYELFENGRSLERADWDGDLHFTTKAGRKAPKFDENFPDPLFSNEGIYIPPCWYDPDADAIKLGLSGFGPEHVARLDYVVLEE